MGEKASPLSDSDFVRTSIPISPFGNHCKAKDNRLPSPTDERTSQRFDVLDSIHGYRTGTDCRALINFESYPTCTSPSASAARSSTRPASRTPKLRSSRSRTSAWWAICSNRCRSWKRHLVRDDSLNSICIPNTNWKERHTSLDSGNAYTSVSHAATEIRSSTRQFLSAPCNCACSACTSSPTWIPMLLRDTAASK